MTTLLITNTAGVNQQLNNLTLKIAEGGKFQLKALALEYHKATGKLLNITDADGNWLDTGSCWASNCHMGLTPFDHAQLSHGSLWQRPHHDIKINGRAAKLLIDYTLPCATRVNPGDSRHSLDYRYVVWAD